MAEVVGTAYVAIRALTNQLASDIKDGVDKGIADVDTGNAGEKLAKKVGDSSKAPLQKSVSESAEGAIQSVGDDSSVNKSIVRSTKKWTERFKDSLQKGFKKADIGKHLGEGLSHGIEKALSVTNVGMIGNIMAVAAPAITQAIQAVGAAVISVVGYLGFLVTAAAGAGIAMAGVFAAVAPAVGLMMFAFKAETDTLKNFQKATEDLKKPWTEVAEIVQKEFLPAVTDAWTLVNSKLIPSFKEYAKGIGPILAGLARFGAETLTSERNVTALDKILTNSGTVMEHLGRAAIIAITPLLDLLARSQPLAEKLAISVRKMAENFAAFVELRGDSISTMFEVWYDRAATVMRILGNLAIALWNVFKIGANASGDMFTNFEKLTDKWATFTQTLEGENRIKAIFDEAAPVTKELWGIITDVVKLIVAPVLKGDSASLVGFLQTVRQDWIPALAGIIGVLKTATTGEFDKLVDAITRLLQVFADNPEVTESLITIFSANMFILTKGLELLAVALDNDLAAKIAPVAAQLFVLGQVMSKFGLLGPALQIMTGMFTVLAGGEVAAGAPVMVALGGALAPVVAILAALAIVAAGVIVVWKNADTIIDWFMRFWEMTDKFGPVLGTFIKILAGILIVVNPLTYAVAAIVLFKKAFENWHEILAKITEVWEGIKNFGQGVKDFFTGLPGLVAGLPGTIGESLGKLFEGFDIGKVADTLFDTLSELPGKIGGFLGNVLERLPGILSTGVNGVIDWLLETFGDLPSKLGEIGAKIFNAIADWFTGLIPKVAPLIGEVIGNIVGFWLGLPFRILGAIPTIVRAFLDFAPQVISGMMRVGSEITIAALSFLIQLPGRLLSFVPVIGNAFLRIFLAIPGFIMSALDGLIGIVLTVLARLPGLIIAALAGIGSLILTALSAAFDQIKSAMPGYLQNVLTFFQELPGKIISALASLGSMLGGVISDAAGAFADGVSNLVSRAVDIITSLPGDLANAIADLAGALGRVVTGAASDVWNGLRNLINEAANILRDLPSRAASAISGFASSLAGAIGGASSEVIRAAAGLVTNALDELGRLPGAIWGAVSGLASDIGGALGSAFRRAWNAMVDTLGGWKWDGPFGVSVGIPTGWLKLAQGAIVRGPVVAQIGEAGAEAVIPLTRPARALTLMQQAGLDKLVMETSGVTAAQTGGEITLLQIENATFSEKVDIDMVVQALMLKYRGVVAL